VTASDWVVCQSIQGASLILPGEVGGCDSHRAKASRSGLPHRITQVSLRVEFAVSEKGLP
jgi:hypothetical protein